MKLWRYYELDDQLLYLYQEVSLEAHLDGSAKLVQRCFGGIRFDGQHLWTPFLPLKEDKVDGDRVHSLEPTTLFDAAKRRVESQAQEDVFL